MVVFFVFKYPLVRQVRLVRQYGCIFRVSKHPLVRQVRLVRQCGCILRFSASLSTPSTTSTTVWLYFSFLNIP